MLDIRFIRENRELVEKSAELKGYEVGLDKIFSLDDQEKKLKHEAEEVSRKSNENARAISGSPTTEQSELGKSLRNELAEIVKSLSPIVTEKTQLLKDIPNVIAEGTPEGGEENNRQEKAWGSTDGKGFEVIDHQTWAEERGLIDFERGAKVAGNKFYFIKGDLVNLELAILQAGMNLAQDNGFEPMLVPHLVNSRVIDGAGFSAKSASEKQIYKIEDEELNLIATAEIPLTGYHADETLAEADLPKLYAGYSPAYRMEAGAYGKHSRGLYRVHQFNKLEMYVYCRPEDSEQWHQKLLELEEKLCQALEIPYRVVRIAAGDLGAPAYKKYDIEYWSPVDGAYRELMSVSNVTDYQSRRLNIKYKKSDGGSAFVHTLNGTAAAMSRMIIAIIENHQQADGSVSVPEVLRNYIKKDKI